MKMFTNVSFSEYDGVHFMTLIWMRHEMCLGEMRNICKSIGRKSHLFRHRCVQDDTGIRLNISQFS